MNDPRIVLSTVATRDEAQRLARALVEERLAACVNVLPGVRSTYRWEGAVVDADEILLVIKTTQAAWPRLAARLAELHPYDVPEVLAVDPGAGAAPYLAWLTESVTAPSDREA